MQIASQRDQDEALQLARKTDQRLQAYLKVASMEHPLDRAEAEDVILVLLNVANIYAFGEQFNDSIAMSRRAIDLARTTNWPAYAGAAELNLAIVYQEQGRLDEASTGDSRGDANIGARSGRKECRKALGICERADPREVRFSPRKAGLVSVGRTRRCSPWSTPANIADDLAQRDPNQFGSRERVFSANVLMAGILRHSDPSARSGAVRPCTDDGWLKSRSIR